ncbi:hypothetical protein [Sedimentitalea todarodis]|uniref:DUF1835 domain-containing protein n=1 Tax=Sedimentitalea todarodis TaxID=1631240 RepID=A0ABU3VH49_9RHOB|nr:hypothetical protein [Sedimentitalea todarodis]MDU9005499.1 hypothetical protein [Sedimentitalea todarodis]
MKILNITNGDGAANIIKQSAVPGDVLPWRDPMHHGPFPAKLSLSELSVLRARYLVGPDADPTGAERDFQLRDRHLNASSSYDSIVLWFEHDLLDQLQILQILDWFSDTKLKDTTLDMICIDSFPGEPNFRGIGQLNAEQMASLLKVRRPVTKKMLDLAASGWAAFRSSDPHDLLAFLGGELSELPFLAAALRRHLEEFPDVATGLNRTETQLLRLVGEGVHNPEHLFLRNMDMETALFVGDWPTYRAIDALCNGGLVTCDPTPFSFPSLSENERHAFNAQRLSLTETGRRVLDCEQDAFSLMRRDGWLGGVELLASGTTWTWDKAAEQLLRREI